MLSPKTGDRVRIRSTRRMGYVKCVIDDHGTLAVDIIGDEDNPQAYNPDEVFVVAAAEEIETRRRVACPSR